MPVSTRVSEIGRRHRIRQFAMALSLCATAIAVGAGSAHAQETAQKFDDWSLVCQTNQAGVQECIIFQEMHEQATGPTIARLTVLKVTETPNPLLIITTPLGVMLPPGVVIYIDQKEIGRMPFQVCIEPGCRSQAEMPTDLLQSFKAGSGGTVKLVRPDGQEMSVTFSLKGFTAAFDALK
jgi:invasion protein IalB